MGVWPGDQELKELDHNLLGVKRITMATPNDRDVLAPPPPQEVKC